MFKYLRVLNELVDNWGVTFCIGCFIPGSIGMILFGLLHIIPLYLFSFVYTLVTLVYCLYKDDLLPSCSIDVTFKDIKKAWKETK